MAISNHERVGKALELLKAGLASFIERELKNVYESKAQSRAELMMECAGHPIFPLSSLF
jgi:hypothetical protein